MSVSLCSLPSSCTAVSFANVIVRQPSKMSEQPQIKRRRGTKHDRTGCLTCRARRKKCVENTLPRCGSCVRLNLECVREPVRRVPGTVATASGEKTIAVQPPQDGLLPGSAHGRSPSTRRFMRYYVNFLALKLTACGYQNSFLSGTSPQSSFEKPPYPDSTFYPSPLADGDGVPNPLRLSRRPRLGQPIQLRPNLPGRGDGSPVPGPEGSQCRRIKAICGHP